jgi:hypothetical protein
LESTYVTRACGTSAAPARAAFNVPLNPDEIWIERISGSVAASVRYRSAKSPGEGCEVVGKLAVIMSRR